MFGNSRASDFGDDKGFIGSDFSVGTCLGSSKEAVWHLKDALDKGVAWPHALVEAMGLWTVREEVVGTQHYRYLIQDEAFNWPLLGRRLLGEMGSSVTIDSKSLVPSFLAELPRSEIR